MPEVIFSEEANRNLYVFIMGYRRPFVELYSDTGIWAEDEIIHDYIKSSEALYEQIRKTIVDKLNKKVVLGRKLDGKISELNFFISDRVVMIVYSEDRKSNIRLVESVFINRKPLIF